MNKKIHEIVIGYGEKIVIKVADSDSEFIVSNGFDHPERLSIFANESDIHHRIGVIYNDDISSDCDGQNLSNEEIVEIYNEVYADDNLNDLDIQRKINEYNQFVSGSKSNIIKEHCIRNNIPFTDISMSSKSNLIKEHCIRNNIPYTDIPMPSEETINAVKEMYESVSNKILKFTPKNNNASNRPDPDFFFLSDDGALDYEP